MNYNEQNRWPDFKDELLQLKSIFPFFESFYFLYMLEGVCVWVDVYMWQLASAVSLHQPHLICATSHWTWGSLTETKLASQQVSGNLPFYFPSTGELLGLQEPINYPGNYVRAGVPNAGPYACMSKHFTNQSMAQPHDSLFLRVPMKKKMDRRFAVLTTNKSYIKGSQIHYNRRYSN